MNIAAFAAVACFGVALSFAAGGFVTGDRWYRRPAIGALAVGLVCLLVATVTVTDHGTLRVFVDTVATMSAIVLVSIGITLTITYLLVGVDWLRNRRKGRPLP